MFTRLTPPEWLIVGLLVTILGRVETSRPLAALGVGLICLSFYRVTRRRS